MTKKHEKVGLAQTKFDLFFDISIIIGIASLLLMLQTIHYLIKFSYKKEIIICDHVAAKVNCMASTMI